MLTNNQLFSLTSPEIDQYFGLMVIDTERDLYQKARALRPEGNLDNLGHVLHGGHQTWVGLEPETLQTPYPELVQMCDLLKPKAGQSMIDLGAGYGRLGLVMDRLYPGVKFTGYELVEERVVEGNRVFKDQGLDGELITQDLTEENFELPHADYYFLYDYGKTAHIRRTLKQLEVLSETKKFKVIARGKGSRSIIDYEHPWLSDIFPVHREENFAIYSMSL